MSHLIMLSPIKDRNKVYVVNLQCTSNAYLEKHKFTFHEVGIKPNESLTSD